MLMPRIEAQAAARRRSSLASADTTAETRAKEPVFSTDPKTIAPMVMPTSAALSGSAASLFWLSRTDGISRATSRVNFSVGSNPAKISVRSRPRQTASGAATVAIRISVATVPMPTSTFVSNRACGSVPSTKSSRPPATI